MSSNPICPRCGKRVYFAERQLYKGNDYHTTCVYAAEKEDTTKPVFGLSEKIFTNPNDPKNLKDSGLGYFTCTKCTYGVGIKNKACPHCGEPVPAHIIAAAEARERGAAPKSCSGCHRELPTPVPNFCASCGTKTQ
eukprot:TRINITY_DN2549_c0_g1_i1.p2 TRINITY_DN2549_c0_g1~~TRINITY_DN2549_c0_g1_i1.p2  ORF type:complete len:136 (+),score=46.45 TRINITY_DN2549_c0_g1_i1:135-542(+)